MVRSTRWQEAKRHVTENEEGERVIVVEFVAITRSTYLTSTSTTKGPRQWQLLDGSGVNCVDENTFKVVETDEILRKV